jgi:ATP-binding protein involved in chromosome partitioning
MAETLQERIERALRTVRNPRTAADVVASEMVRDIATTTGGKIRLTLLLSASDDATLVRDVRHALERIDGVTEVRVDVKDPSEVGGRRSGGAPRALPVMDPGAASQQQRVAAPTPVVYPQLGRIIAVSSGKGGVGKSTVATNLAIALAQRGARVGLMDADIYGPNIPRMMGVDGPPPVEDVQGVSKIIPHVAHGVKVMSLGFMIERDQPAIWRGPIVMKIVTQFLRDVDWGQLDYLFVDMPPGTGDAQLSLVQATQVRGAVIVTTPQAVAVGDALRGAKMFERVNVPVLGIVENMSWFECPHCGKPSSLFGSGGGRKLADELGLPLLGEIPLYPRVLEGGDRGMPIVVAEPSSSAAKALGGLADQVGAVAGGLPGR